MSIPGITRKTAKGVPHYLDATDSDIFILSGSEDLVPLSPFSTHRRYRPRTEGLFARIERVYDPAASNDYWEVRSKDGLVSIYGTPGQMGDADRAAVARSPRDKYAWKLTETRDPFGNRIVYTYDSDQGQDGSHHWQQPLLERIDYAEFDDQGRDRFLISVSLSYEDRSDSFSDYRAGFEIRTTKRCRSIGVKTNFDRERPVRRYDFTYQTAPANGVSLLGQVEVIGFDDEGRESRELPPLKFDYTAFHPETAAWRSLIAVAGPDLPSAGLGQSGLELADLTGNGLPDIFQMDGPPVRSWRNLGGAAYDLPLSMDAAPPVSLADPGVQLLDANGDGRVELMVTKHPLAGYFRLNFNGEWDRDRSFHRYDQPPTVDLEDPEVRLLDLNGDGVTDALRTANRLECYFNDPQVGWNRMEVFDRQPLEVFPNVNFSDPRVKLGDMNGDGLQDILLIHDGEVAYWPNLGHGHWGGQVTMSRSPVFKDFGYSTGYDPARVLVGDVDGDGLADLLYVGSRCVVLWINHSGNGWSSPMIIEGTPDVTSDTSLRLVDLLGSGISGVLWSSPNMGRGSDCWFFLDLTGKVKPYLLAQIDNQMGAVTRVEYTPSTQFYLADQQTPAARWKTHLPFPVQVVSRVVVTDHFSQGKLATTYKYHHGYWDGVEREFRGFGMVEQFDSETFDRYHQPDDGAAGFSPVDRELFAQPTLARTWFHLGALEVEDGSWQEADWSGQFWTGDSPMLDHAAGVRTAIALLPGSRQRDALRALRGSVLRSELYAPDDSARAEQPYTVTESAYGVALVDGSGPQAVFFPHLKAQRTTQWERGADPLTTLSFTGYLDEAGRFDPYGRSRRQDQIACPRGWRPGQPAAGDRYLALRVLTDYAARDDDRYIVDRVKRAATLEYRLPASGLLPAGLLAIQDGVLACIGQTVHHYDELGYGRLGASGALTQSEVLALTPAILTAAYGAQISPYLPPGAVNWPAEYPAGFRSATAGQAGYVFHDAASEAQYQTGYYVRTRRKVDPRRGLVVEQTDALGNRTTIEYDRELLPCKVTDPLGLATLAEYNYRALQPSLVTDSNLNRTVAGYTALGLPAHIAAVGKDGAREGDRRSEADAAANRPARDFPSTVYRYDYQAYLNSPPASRQPVSVLSIRRQQHFWDVVQAEADRRGAALTGADIDALFPPNLADEMASFPARFLQTREYSDGVGRLLQTRAQGEEQRFGDPVFGSGLLPADPADVAGARAAVQGVERSDPAAPNVIVSGWQIFDNKGQVVEKFEPFFDAGWAYTPPAQAQMGQSVRMFYDPRGQVIRTCNPNGSEQRVIFGVPGSIPAPDLDAVQGAEIAFEPTPWEAYTYDANDLAALTRDPSGQPLAGRAPAAHHFTPTSVEIDALGRPVKTTQHGAASGAGPIVTRTHYDLRGNPIEVTDALGRPAFQHVFDLLNRRLRLQSLDAGERQTFFDAANRLVEARDHKGIQSAGVGRGAGALILRAYDALGRLKAVWARDAAGQAVTQRERLTYGDEGNRNDASRHNSLGRLVRHLDEAGLVELGDYDFKGNLLLKTRRVITGSALAAGWRPNWDAPNAENSLGARVYETDFRFDALNRPVSITYPADVGNHRARLQPVYDRAGLLQQVRLDGAVYVERIAYNARGQRTLVALGNGVLTRSSYDPHTFRLVRLRAERYDPNRPSALVYQPAGVVIQDFAYVYDLVGNIGAIVDHAPGSGVRNTPEGCDRLARRFTYDPFYRLVEATGRQAARQPVPCTDFDPRREGFNWAGGAPSANPQNACDLTSLYTESYQYDPAGNLLSLGRTGSPTQHFGMGGFNPQQWLDLLTAFAAGQAPDWGRQGNRLTHAGGLRAAQSHTYDENGNLSGENTERHFTWDHADRLVGFTHQATPACQASLEARYLYGADGSRVLKWVRTNGTGPGESTTYIDGVYEHHAWQDSGQGRENYHLHVMDNQSRVALARTGNRHPEDTGPAVQYPLSDHLGSSAAVLGGADHTGSDFINQEEYYPYGETSFGSFGKKRYRYSGKERDEESGLYYYGARYLAPWLGRWASCDPAWTVDGLHLYQFARLDPISRRDRNGQKSEKADGPADAQTGGAKPGNPGIRLGEVKIHGVPYAHYKRIEGTWVSASAKAEGLPFDKKEGYGAYRDIILGKDLAPLATPDYGEPGEEYFVPLQSPAGLEQQIEDVMTLGKPAERKGSDRAFARCEGVACEAGLGFDEQGAKIFRGDAKGGFDPERMLGGRGSVGLFSFENEYVTLETFTASADLYREKEGDTTMYGIGAQATMVGGSYKKIPIPVGEQTEMIFGLSLGLGLGLKVTRQEVADGRSLDTAVASFGLFTFGLKGVE